MPYYRKRAQPKRKRKRTAKPVSKAVKAFVKRTIHIQAENKIASPYGAVNGNVIPYTVAGTPAIPTQYDLTQSLTIAQGTSQNQRVGNRVTLRKVMLRGHILPDVVTVPVMFRMVLYKLKNGVESPILTDWDLFFQDGSGALPPSNTPLDMYLPINKDRFKVFKQQKFTLQLYNATVPQTINKQMHQFSIDITKAFPKKLIYDDSTNSNIPQNAGLYMAFLATRLDGTVLTDGADIASLTFKIETQYEDL